MNNFLVLIFLILSIELATASSLPQNNLKIYSHQKSFGLNELQYNRIINKIENYYRPIIEKSGYELTINRSWNDPTVNAGTLRNGKEWIINMYGGYARHPMITEDGFALVLCHELGHHLGGAPKKYFDQIDPSWPSTEGQADYFATLKCLRKIFRSENNVEAISHITPPELVQKKCASSFNTEWEKALCIRSTLAGISVSNVSADVTSASLPNVATPDLSKVDRTYEVHPSAQCRLDTYFQGSICEISSAREVSDTDEAKGTCHPRSGHKSGNRPLCWFKPELKF